MDVVDKLRPILPYVKEVKLNGGGEPFMVRGIEKFLDIFSGYGIRLNTTTNATLINERIARRIGSSFSTLYVSMDGVSKETYEFVRVNAKFEDFLRGLDLVQKYRRPSLRMSLGFVAMKCNMHELPALVEFAAERSISSVHVALMVPFDDLPWTHDQDPTLDPERTNRFLADARSRALSLNIELQAPSCLNERGAPPKWSGADSKKAGAPTRVKGLLLPPSRVEGVCHMMYDRAMVMVNGNVKPCCHARKSVGNIMERSFKEIWNGEEYQKLRRTFNSGVLPEACRNCNFLRSDQLDGARLSK